jgi:2-oxoglutarate ferredoxin oxidoreductase subunit beta
MGKGGMVMKSSTHETGYDYLTNKYLRKRKIPSTACPGCGLGQGHKALLQAIYDRGYEVPDIIWGTSIGCAGRQTFATWKGDGFAGTHGRVYAIATGLRLALPPEKKIVITVGEGDAFGIGLNHLLNAARRNIDATIVVLDNIGYQSTGGQYSWVTPEGAVTDSSPYGMFEPNWLQGGRDILNILREAGATFVARHVSMDGEYAVESLRRALGNRGFSLVHIVFPCVTNFASTHLGSRNSLKIFNWIKDHARRLDEEPAPDTIWRTGIYHDASNSRVEFSELVRENVQRIQRSTEK